MHSSQGEAVFYDPIYPARYAEIFLYKKACRFIQCREVSCMRVKWKQLIIAVLIPLAVGGVSALLTRGGMMAFNTLQKPPLSPPAWVFPVVWTVLYILMGVASYLVATATTSRIDKDGALSVYALQLAFNFLWSIIFFNLEMYRFALVWLVLLLLLVVITAVRFYRINKAAGLLLVPYIVWLIIAAYLNFQIVLLNP